MGYETGTRREVGEGYVFAFYTQGTVAIIGKWLENNCRDDVEKIIDLIMRHTMAYGWDEKCIE